MLGAFTPAAAGWWDGAAGVTLDKACHFSQSFIFRDASICQETQDLDNHHSCGCLDNIINYSLFGNQGNKFILKKINTSAALV